MPGLKGKNGGTQNTVSIGHLIMNPERILEENDFFFIHFSFWFGIFLFYSSAFNFSFILFLISAGDCDS